MSASLPTIKDTIYLFFDDLSIAQYNKFCHIRDLSFKEGEGVGADDMWWWWTCWKRYCIRILEYMRCDILLDIYGQAWYSKYDTCLCVICTNKHSTGVTLGCPRLPFMCAGILRFCKQSVHFLAPKIHIFSPRRNDFFVSQMCVVTVCWTISTNPLHIVLYHNYHKKKHSSLLRHHFCHSCIHKSPPNLAIAPPPAAASPVPQSIIPIGLTAWQYDSLTHRLNRTSQQSACPARRPDGSTACLRRLGASTPWRFNASKPRCLDALTLWCLDVSCLDNSFTTATLLIEMSQCNYDDLQGGAKDGSEELQHGWRNTRSCTAYEHRGISSLTPAQVMDQQTYCGYAWMSLVQGMNVLQLVLLHLASYLCLHLLLGRIGHSMGNYASEIRAKIQDKR